jgi:5-methylcytosine-specific restriction endonuclease McrA
MARTRNQGSKWIRPDRRLAIYLRDDCACAYCGRDATMGAVLTLDHIIACELLDRPDNSSTNLITACRSCNSSKQDITMRAWYKVLRANGRDTKAISRYVRTHSKRDIKAYRTTAKALIASMTGSFANYGELAAASVA